MCRGKQPALRPLCPQRHRPLTEITRLGRCGLWQIGLQPAANDPRPLYGCLRPQGAPTSTPTMTPTFSPTAPMTHYPTTGGRAQACVLSPVVHARPTACFLRPVCYNLWPLSSADHLCVTTFAPTAPPTHTPTAEPTETPTNTTQAPTPTPTYEPTNATMTPTETPSTPTPTRTPSTPTPTDVPTHQPSDRPTVEPTRCRGITPATLGRRNAET